MYMYIYIHIHIHICVSLSIYIYVNVYVRVYMYSYAYVYIYIYGDAICMYICGYWITALEALYNDYTTYRPGTCYMGNRGASAQASRQPGRLPKHGMCDRSSCGLMEP